MAKLTLLLAAFALFLLVANASVYRTTVEIDDENPSRQGSCQEQIRRQQQLSHCQMFLRERSRRSGRDVATWGWNDDDNQQQHLRQCCEQLEQMDSRCRCEGLEQAVRRQQQQGQGQQGRQLFEEARDIPRRCNLQPTQGCEFRSPY